MDGTIRGVHLDNTKIDVYCNRYVLERYDLINQCSADWIDDFFCNDNFSFTQDQFESFLEYAWQATTMRSEHEVTFFDIADECESIMKEWPDDRVLKMWDEIKSSFSEVTKRSDFDIEEVNIRKPKRSAGQGLKSILGIRKDDE